MGLISWLMGTEPGAAEMRTGSEETLSVRAGVELPPSTPPALVPPRREDAPLSDSALLRTIAVYRAVDLLSLGVAQLTADVWRGKELLSRPSIIRNPDVNMRWRSWVKENISSLALTGNAFWKIDRNDRGEPINIKVLNPHECEPLEDGTLSWAKRNTPLNSKEFRHLGLLRIPGRRRALGPIEAARMELAGAIQTARYGAEFHNSGDVPTGILKTDQVLSPTQASSYKKTWQERESHEVAVLGQGLDYKPILLSPADAQFLETRQFDTVAIARLFGIPARLFLASIEGGSMTYANISQDDLAFVRWTLSDYIGEIEDALSSVLPGQQECRFNLDGLLRPDTKSRYEAHQLGINAGWLLKSEVRDIEGLPPKPGIDKAPVAPTPEPAPTLEENK